MITIKSVVKLCCVPIVMVFITACTHHNGYRPTDDFLQQQEPTALAVDNELIVLLTEDADIAKLKIAWQIFELTYSYIGPEKNRLLLIKVPAAFELDQVKANISQTKGVSQVQLNDIKEPAKENNSLEIMPKKTLILP